MPNREQFIGRKLVDMRYSAVGLELIFEGEAKMILPQEPPPPAQHNLRKDDL
jgi:hypothetical protein